MQNCRPPLMPVLVTSLASVSPAAGYVKKAPNAWFCSLAKYRAEHPTPAGLVGAERKAFNEKLIQDCAAAYYDVN